MQMISNFFGIVGIILVAIACIFFVLAVYTCIELWFKLHFHRCPYCGKRMTYDHLHEDDDIDKCYYEFYCEQCGAHDKVNFSSMHK